MRFIRAIISHRTLPTNLPEAPATRCCTYSSPVAASVVVSLTAPPAFTVTVQTSAPLAMGAEYVQTPDSFLNPNF